MHVLILKRRVFTVLTLLSNNAPLLFKLISDQKLEKAFEIYKPSCACVWIRGLLIDDRSIKIIISIPDHVSSHPHTASPLCGHRFKSSSRYSQAIFFLQMMVHNVFFPQICLSATLIWRLVCLSACQLVCVSPCCRWLQTHGQCDSDCVYTPYSQSL